MKKIIEVSTTTKRKHNLETQKTYQIKILYYYSLKKKKRYRNIKNCSKKKIQ